jgi:hypothetical protein
MLINSRFTDLLGKSVEAVESSGVLPFDLAVHDCVEGRVYVEFFGLGVGLGFGESGALRSIFFDCDARSPKVFLGVLCQATRGGLVSSFGMPSKSGSAQMLPVLGLMGAWDRWDGPDFSVHVQYASTDDTVAKVTLMHPSAVPD